MKDLLKTAFFTGLGAALLTREKVAELAQDLAKRSQLTQEEGRQLVQELTEKSEEARTRLEEEVTRLLHKQVERLDLCRRQDLEPLRERLAALEKRLEGQGSDTA